MRGADCGVVCPALQIVRFTPTCVGQMKVQRLQRRHIYPVHPHMRGADAMRYFQEGRRIRFTPTCVGQMKEEADTKAV